MVVVKVYDEIVILVLKAQSLVTVFCCPAWLQNRYLDIPTGRTGQTKPLLWPPIHLAKRHIYSIFAQANPCDMEIASVLLYKTLSLLLFLFAYIFVFSMGVDH